MTDADLAATIDAAWETREALTPATRGPARDAVEAALDGLDGGRLRVAEKTRRALAGPPMAEEGGAAVVPPQRHGRDPRRPDRSRARCIALVGQGAVEIRRAGSSNRFRAAGFRAVPGAIVRRSAYIAPSVVLMPSFVNVGAYVDSGTMVDTWATVGSCAQIGKNCHLSGGVGIGGVLEPLQAEPVIIEDNCFIGARSEVVEGVIVEDGLGAGDGHLHQRHHQDRRPRHRRDPSRPRAGLFGGGAGLLPGRPLPDGSPGPSLYCAVIVKRVDEQTRAKTSINELLRD